MSSHLLYPYIDLKKTDDKRIAEKRTTQWLLERLDRVVNNTKVRPIATLIGPSGSGKRRLLEHWATTRVERKANNPHETPLMVYLKEDSSPDRLEFTMLRQMWVDLHKIVGTEYKVRDTRGKERYNTYSRRNSEFLHQEVSEFLEETNINPLIIIGAHHLNIKTLGTVMGFRSYRHPQKHTMVLRRSLILSATQQDEESRGLVTLLKSIPEAQAAWWREGQITMQRLNSIEFTVVFLKMLLDNLKVKEFDRALDIDEVVSTWHGFTEGNWWNIARLANVLESTLKAMYPHKPRVLNDTVLKRVQWNMRLKQTNTV